MREVEVSFEARENPSREQIINKCARQCGVQEKNISYFEVLRKSLDARGGGILAKYRVQVAVKGEQIPEPFKIQPYLDCSNGENVIIIGAGPAGLFAALTLLQLGKKPVILERGKDVHSRKFDTAKLSREQIVNPNSNYCFGEGGAGTFSDGKLYTRSTKKGDIREVLYQFVKFGADPSILIDAHPHIGSDKLPAIIEAMRNCIIEHGGEVHFNSKVSDLQQVKVENNVQWRVICQDAEYVATSVILATGHSARDIYQLFYDKKWDLQAKGFALGVRAEHPQSLINNIQYHKKWQPYLPAAEYYLVTQVENRGVFSFCMCPGGILVPAATEPGEVVLNGMSNSMRNSKWANAGIVTSVEPEDLPDFEEFGALKVLKFQQSVERKIYSLNGGTLKAPAQRMDDFVRGKLSATLPATSYVPGAYSAMLNEVLPDFVARRLQKAFPEFDKKMRGYYTSQSLLLAVESRTSSPVRIPRDPETLQHITLKNLYPCGEGAGYSGGIVSSAIDGINVARKI
ncbi:MAG: NAD(P)/FAD-dependent oxidoreductase [Bacteroidales bacterium]|jgi:uncharacterized protein|nr:NAD(P)/FAD-dependent oxidoreductase [Bacteroidales bacterium]